MALVAMYFGVDPSVVLNMGQGLQQDAPVEAQAIPQDDPMAKFVAKVLGSTEDTWEPMSNLKNNAVFLSYIEHHGLHVHL